MNVNIGELLEQKKIVVIVRKVYGTPLRNLAEALIEGGIRFLEVTFDQADKNCVQKTQEAISQLNDFCNQDVYVGAGTVLTENQVLAAHAANAKFIISPNIDSDVIRRTKQLGLLSIPGAMTPSEILSAHKYGADFVKIFPANDLGLRYIKNIKAPIPHVKMVATAGINEENFADYLKAGYVGAGISGRLTEKALIEGGDFIEITKRARVFCDIAEAAAKAK